MKSVCLVVWGVLICGVLAKPYHVKITKHSSPKSRDLSKHSSPNEAYPPEPTENHDGESFTKRRWKTLEAERWKDWTVMQWIYNSTGEKLYKNPDISDDEEERKEARKDLRNIDKGEGKLNLNENDVLPTSKPPKTLPYERAEEQWKEWTPLREDYGSEENLYKNVDIFDDEEEEKGAQRDIKNTWMLPKDGKIFNHEDKESVQEQQQIDIKNFEEEKGKLNFNENDVLPTSKLPKTLPYDPCHNVNCHYGRVCKAYPDGAATCECGDETLCLGHKKQVCGSDGSWYLSHCELHRQACVQRKHISIDHAAGLCDMEAWKLLEKEKEPVDLQDKKADNDEAVEGKLEVGPTEEGEVVGQGNGEEKEVENMLTLQEDDVKIERVKKTDMYLERMDRKKDKNRERKEKRLMGKNNVNKAKEVPQDAVNEIIKTAGLEEEKTTLKLVAINKIPETTVTPGVEESLSGIDVPVMSEICIEEDFERLKSNMMVYHCARIGESDCHNLGKKKQFLANIMFQYYDRNANGLLDTAEMTDIDHRDHLGKLSRFCHLEDMVQFDDLNRDDNITLTEFYHAFGISHVTLNKKLTSLTRSVTLGNSLELKCDVTGATEVVWKRNGGLLSEAISDEIKIFESGSLYIGNVGLEHQGNYSCQDKNNEEVVQTHVLSVHMPPMVKVNPSTQFHATGSTVSLHCRVNGLPKPEIEWEMNESPLKLDPEHYTLFYNNATLEIKSARYTTDTGAYKCKAKNSAGTAQDIATVFIENQQLPKYSQDVVREAFLVFSDDGYTVYEPVHCNIEHQVSRGFTKFKHVPLYGTTFNSLCPKMEDGNCVWGGAVNVKNQYVYATQPKLNRVVVIDILDNHNPVEVIQTDPTPVAIKYLAHLDQIWVVCWNGEEDGAAKTAVVIRDASQAVQHHTVHTQPIGDRFDLIQDIFLPPNNELGQKLNYGYVVHPEQQGLYKVDLTALKYVKMIDLKQYACVPSTVAFVPIGGQVMVHCSAPSGEEKKLSRLVLDYITDEVLEVSELAGEPHVSPDGQYLVTVDRDTNTIAVYQVKENGKLQHIFEEYTSFHVSDMTFFPSERGHSYDFYATSINRNALLYINLASGKIEIIEGVGKAVEAKEWPWSSHSRAIVSGGIFGEYLMTPSDHSALIINGKRRHVQCEWEELQHAHVIVWVEHSLNL